MKIPGYDLALPDRAVALSLLSEAFGPREARQLWKTACEATQSPLNPEGIEDLKAIYHYFSQQSGRLAVHGMSLKVRLMTYQNLLALQTKNISK